MTSELIGVTTVNVTATAPSVFISLDGGSGEGAIAVNQMDGNNVLNGSTGSSFLYGGTGKDTFFVDDRNPPADSSIWSIVVNFHSGDKILVPDFDARLHRGAGGFRSSWGADLLAGVRSQASTFATSGNSTEHEC